MHDADIIDMLQDHDGSFGAASLDDLFNVVRDAVTDTGREAVDRAKDVVEDRGTSEVQNFLNSTGGKVLLQAVEKKAQDAVVKEVSKNAIALFALAISGGAIGGFVFRGKAGLGVATGLAVWSVYMIAGGSASAPAPKR